MSKRVVLAPGYTVADTSMRTEVEAWDGDVLFYSPKSPGCLLHLHGPEARHLARWLLDNGFLDKGGCESP